VRNCLEDKVSQHMVKCFTARGQLVNKLINITSQLFIMFNCLYNVCYSVSILEFHNLTIINKTCISRLH
jgi:hypothetical protein